jgi:hypothetical protein
MQIESTKEMFNMLNIKDDCLTLEQKKFLSKNGYLVIEPLPFFKKNLNTLNNIIKKLIKEEGSKGGWEGKEQHFKEGKYFEPGCERLGNLIEKDILFSEIIVIPEILAAAYHVIKSEIKVSGFNFRNPNKGYGEQGLHIDIFPRKKKTENFSGIVAYVYLDDSSVENGAVRIVPKSHEKLGWPDDYIDTTKRFKDEIRGEVKAGSIIIINLNTWHAGAINKNGHDRKTMFLQIKRRDEPQLLNYKKFLSENTKKQLNEEKKYLLATRDIDPTQKEDSYSVGDHYRKLFGTDRGAIKK